MSGTDFVAISKLRPHPLNPRKGKTEGIATSLKVNSQYSPIVVHRPSMHIIVGNHTWKAAKLLGWKNINVVWYDGSEQEALEILLADNNSSDKGTTDEAAAFQLLQTLPSLEGTGYVLEDLQMPDVNLDEILDQPAPSDTPADPAVESVPKPYTFRVGGAKGWLNRELFDQWRTTLPKKNTQALVEILDRLSLTEPPVVADQGGYEMDVELANIDDLEEYPGNPRQGDVGLIMGLLVKFNQYKPIVVNRRNNRILKGNHVTKAARQLGWDKISVSYVDVDAEGERRIVVGDNRWSDLATYDNSLLGQAILAVDPRSLLSLGFSLEDLDVLGNGGDLKTAAHDSSVKLVIGPFSTKVKLGMLRDLNLTEGKELVEVAAILGIEPRAVLADVNPATKPI